MLLHLDHGPKGQGHRKKTKKASNLAQKTLKVLIRLAADVYLMCRKVMNYLLTITKAVNKGKDTTKKFNEPAQRLLSSRNQIQLVSLVIRVTE